MSKKSKIRAYREELRIMDLEKQALMEHWNKAQDTISRLTITLVVIIILALATFGAAFWQHLA